LCSDHSEFCHGIRPGADGETPAESFDASPTSSTDRKICPGAWAATPYDKSDCRSRRYPFFLQCFLTTIPSPLQMLSGGITPRSRVKG
jgi:hypothetical protein